MSTELIIAMICLALFGGYVFTSLLLLRFPTLIHEKKKSKFKCRHISHRGGAGENLENTMAAFRHAKEAGTDMFEIDCHITEDGQVVVSHDNNLQRVTGMKVLISETKYNQLPQLKPHLRLDFSPDHVTIGKGDKQIPLLRDVFDNFPEMPINIDIKIDDDELIAKVSQLITRYNREELTVWGNRNGAVVDKCYRTNPNVHILFSLKKVLYTVLMFYTGILPFVPIKESFYEIPFCLPEQFGNRLGWKMRTAVRICDFFLTSKVMFRHLQRRGIQVYVWVLNNEREFDKAFKHSCTGVMTDFPTKLSDYLKEHPEYCNRPV